MLKIKAHADTFLGWSVFLFTFVIYLFTAQQQVGFWDSGEFISAASNLQVLHPPGSPLYVLLARFFLIFIPISNLAYGVSVFSAFAASFSVAFAYWIFILLIKIIKGNSQSLIVKVSGITAALTIAFSTTFWTSATEAEVYSLSTFFIGLVVWSSLKWYINSEDRWLVLTVFIIGLSSGVHIINLAYIIPFSILFYVKNWGVNWKKSFLALSAGVFIFFFSKSFLMLGLVKLGVSFEVFGVNSLGMALHTGELFFGLVLIASFSLAIYYTHKKQLFHLNKAIVLALVFILGTTSYISVIIRSDVKKSLSNNASNFTELLGYLKSDQFGFSDIPLLYGPNYNSPLNRKKPYNKESKFEYNSKENKYEIREINVPNFDSKYSTFFPRMYSTDANDINEYKKWVNIKGKKKRLPNNSFATIPSFMDNFRFFINYQLSWLNIRYFLWNFSGKQNDIKGDGSGQYGNWLSGISFYDNFRLGAPENSDKSKSTNYYLLPLLMGLVGVYAFYKSNKKAFLYLILCFLAFSVALTIFINQPPTTAMIRERDYIFSNAYFFFGFFIGFGVYFLSNKLFKNTKPIYHFFSLIFILLIPFQLLSKGFNNQNKSTDNFAYKVALETLQSCPKNAILVTSGDNLTIPLWNIQEIQQIRTDVIVINHQMLGVDWYVGRLSNYGVETQLAKNSKAIKNNISITKYINSNSYVPVKNVMELFNNILAKGDEVRFMPTSHFMLLNKNDTIKWDYKKTVYNTSDIFLLDIISSNFGKRDIYFTHPGYTNHFLGLEAFTVQEGIVSRLTSKKTEEKNITKQAIHTGKSLAFLEKFSDFNLQAESYLNNSIYCTVFMPKLIKIIKALIQSGENDKAYLLLKKYDFVKNYPEYIHKEFIIDVIDCYYLLGKKEEAAGLLYSLVDFTKKELDYLTAYKSYYNKNQESIIEKKMIFYYNVLKTSIGRIPQFDGERNAREFEKYESVFTTWKRKNSY